MFKYLESFNFEESFRQLENLKEVSQDDESIKSLNTFQVEIIFVAHMQALIMLLYRTEEIPSALKDSLLLDLEIFFKHVKLDTGVFKTDMTETIELLKFSSAKNIATQLSTEPTYFFARLVYLRGLTELEEIKSFLNSLKGTVIVGYSYKYGTTFVREIFEN